MKLVFDERIKHRLVGLAVVVSLAAIFAPAIMKKSSQRFDSPPSIAVKLPAKPKMPDVEMADEKAMFETVKVAHVDIPTANEEFEPATTIAKAEPLKEVNDPKIREIAEAIEAAPAIVAKERLAAKSREDNNPPPAKQIALIKKNSVRPVAKLNTRQLGKQTKPVIALKSMPTATVAVKNVPGYAVQVALFSRQTNAVVLVNRLRSKGFKASFSRVQTPTGVAFKVLVGQSAQKEQAQKIKVQLASSMQIQGFVVPTTGIS